MGPKDADGKYAVRVEDKFGRKIPTGIKRLSSEGMRRDDALDRAKELLEKQPSQPFKLGRFTVTPVKPAAKKTQKKGGRKTRRKKRHRRRRTRKRKQTKRRVKKRRKTTRKKRGRGIGPSKMAKGATAALAASAVMGQGMGHGISPSKGTAAAVNHFKNVACSDFHIGDVVPHSEDHGQTTEHYRPVLRAALAKKQTCKRKGQRMRNPNTGKPMSNKKKNQAEKRRRAQERAKAERAKAERAKAEKAAEQQRQQDIEREVMEEMERERAQDSSSNEGSQGMSKTEMAAYGAAAAAAGISLAEYIKRREREMGRGRPRVRNTRIVTRNDGRRFQVRLDDGSVIRELTPERR